MEELKDNLQYLKFTKDIVLNKNPIFFKHQTINEKVITPNTISIVMTAHERSKQVYFTLYTINKCKIKDIQLILVDDSRNDPIDIELLKGFGIHIDFITIKKGNKFWTNPCVNYNIGFQYIKGGKVVIQNSEVCYIGDILQYVNDNVKDDNNYYVFDVYGSRNYNKNEEIYKILNLDSSIFKMDISHDDFNGWFQHSIYRNANYHYLTALTINTFNRLKGFSYDYSFGRAYDDDDFVIKIKANNINFINVKSELEYIGGIHLYHTYNPNIADRINYIKEMNNSLFYKKKRYFETNNKYLEISECNDSIELQEKYNELNRY
jgi:hypothetical protein